MINTEVWGIMVRYCKVQVLLLGDTAQLKPVGEKTISPIFDQVDLSFNLTQVQRYSGNLLKLATEVRSNLNRASALVPLLDKTYCDNTVLGLEKEKFKADFLRRFKEQGTLTIDTLNSIVVAAWTNNAVNSYNSLVRSMLYPESKETIQKDEFIILNRPMVDLDTVLFTNSAILQITGIEQGDKSITNVINALNNLDVPDVPMLYEYYETLEVEVCEVSTGKKEIAFIVNGLDIVEYINPKNKKKEKVTKWEYNLRILKALAQSSPAKARNIWKLYYQIFNAVIHWNYVYSCTIHKLQGSSIDTVYLALHDCLRNPDISDRNQLIYTGITRAKKELIYSI
jgi:hypothetical protein